MRSPPPAHSLRHDAGAGSHQRIRECSTWVWANAGGSMWSRWKTAAVMAAFVGAPLTASAQLDSIGPVNQNGTGFGNVNTVLTLSSPANSSTEAGCIGPAIATCVPGD